MAGEPTKQTSSRGALACVHVTGSRGNPGARAAFCPDIRTPFNHSIESPEWITLLGKILLEKNKPR